MARLKSAALFQIAARKQEISKRTIGEIEGMPSLLPRG